MYITPPFLRRMEWEVLYLKHLFYSLMMILFFGMTATLAYQLISVVPASETISMMTPVVIIDAGHGGEDGGAISLTGVSESTINLAIAKKVEQVLAFYGAVPMVLREEDISLHDSDATTLREKKRSDLKNRVAMIESVPDAILVSIHQNTYEGESTHGFQTFAATTDGSKEIAEGVQQTLIKSLDIENKRKVKPMPNTVYIMEHITCPAILIECGFLTNKKEEAMLQQEDYQKQLAAAITVGVLTYIPR